MKTVAVFFGGKSTEREISILTGLFVLNVLDKREYTPVPVYIHADGESYSSREILSLDHFKRFNG